MCQEYPYILSCIMAAHIIYNRLRLCLSSPCCGLIYLYVCVRLIGCPVTDNIHRSS